MSHFRGIKSYQGSPKIIQVSKRGLKSSFWLKLAREPFIFDDFHIIWKLSSSRICLWGSRGLKVSKMMSFRSFHFSENFKTWARGGPSPTGKKSKTHFASNSHEVASFWLPIFLFRLILAFRIQISRSRGLKMDYWGQKLIVGSLFGGEMGPWKNRCYSQV